ncbi:ABC transporter permease [candidate division TA06 bacterium]|nr:ABC transporter permease [candidate division TA06 bacterium]
MKLAWRNLFRNKRRTLIAGLALGLGLAAMIFVDALVIGTVDNMVRLATSSFMGEAQIMNREFRASQAVEAVIADAPAVLSGLKNERLVENYAPRVLSLAMITSPANVSSVQLVGVSPEQEKHLSKIDDAVAQGAFFSGGDERDIVIGVKLAEVLEAGLGDRVVLTVAQANSGDLSQELFRISGIFDIRDRTLNGGLAFVRLGTAQRMLGIGQGIHQVAVKFRDPQSASDTSLPFWGEYSRDGNLALSWGRLMPELQSMIGMSGYATMFIGVVLVGVVAFVILNTLFMSIFERMFEFGVLRALGTRPSGIAQLILFEAGALAAISIIIGCALALALTAVFSVTGINYSGTEFYGMALRELIYPVITPRQYLLFPLYILLFTVMIGIYPAIHAARIPPAQAMRKSF